MNSAAFSSNIWALIASMDFTIFAEFDGIFVQIQVTSNGVIDSKWLQMEGKNRSWWFKTHCQLFEIKSWYF